MKNILKKLFKKNNKDINVSIKGPIRDKYTIEFIEKRIGAKLEFPNQFVKGDMDEKKYDELRSFGCSDILDDKGHWLHRDCFIKNCEQCNFYPVVKECCEKNRINPNAPADFVKCFILKFKQLCKFT